MKFKKRAIAKIVTLTKEVHNLAEFIKYSKNETLKGAREITS